MTVLRSRKIVSSSSTQNQHSSSSSPPNPNPNPNPNPKSATDVGVKIEPITPAKQEVEPIIIITSNNSSSSSFETTSSTSDKPGGGLLAVGATDSASISSRRGLRRSARLSFNSSTSNVNHNHNNGNNTVVVVENVGASTRKRKVDNGEKGIMGNGSWNLNLIQKDSGSGGLVSQGDDVGNGLRSGKKPVINHVASDSSQKESEGEACFVLLTGDGVQVDEAKGGSSGYANGDHKARKQRFSRQDKKKGVLVDAQHKLEIDLNSYPINFSPESDSIGLEDNGKGKGIKFDSSSSSESDMHDAHVESQLGNPMDATIAAAADTGNVDPATTERAGTSSNMRHKEIFRNIARKNASRFAFFSVKEDEQQVDEDEVELQQTEANGDVEDWPGPFSTAMKIIRDRAANMPAQHKDATSNKIKSSPPIWVPKENQRRGRLMKVAPSLQDLCMAVMVENSDAITSLESVPDVLRHKLTHLLCETRKMNLHFLDLLARGSPSEIRIRDCSWLNEEQFTKTLENTDTSKLMVLQLDQCGRCFPDFVLFTTLAHSPSKFSALTNISLKGACRLSDAGLNALVASTPALRSINLGCCSLLTPDGIISLADKLGPVLKELYIDECFGLDDKRILPALMKLKHLEVLSISRFETITDSFVIKFVAVQGQKMKELVLADCMKLTDKAVKAIAENCPGLCAIDLTNLCKLTDNAIGHLANGCPKIQTMKFCRNAFSDEAVAAYVEARGGPLKELSLNHVNKVGFHTALSLAKHAKDLQTLDLSWCRDMTDEALGLVVDSCLSLKLLKLFGCTQITNVFMDGHSNEEVKVTGLKGSQVLKNIVVPDYLPLRYSSV